MIGKKFGRSLVISAVEPATKGRLRFLCQCDCGALHESDGRHLRSGGTTSCGCLGREHVIAAAKSHGKSKTPDYMIWRSMKTRCTLPTVATYHHYGGRGISVCSQWMESFETFMKDMGPRPPGYSIERINNDGNYEPSNCKWASKSEQSINRRNSKFLEHDGLKLTQHEWSLKTGLSSQNIYTRLRMGWSVHRALTTPVNHPKKCQLPA